ncbi:MAG: dCTP deaminase [Thermoplasmatales archaeon]|nr:dCTP deaminase [Thermoplasmatales archaeon]
MLSDRDIKEHILKGELEINPFEEKNLTPNGYDLTIDEIFINGKKEKKAIIKPLTWFAISTKEYIKLKNLSAQLWIRSTYARKGIFASFGKVDAGFEGCLTISCFNAYQEIELGEGDKFCQIVFEKISSKPEKYYNGKYKGQREIKI